MCTPFAEMIQKTTHPFITAINDASCPRAVALDGKVLVVGEALNLMRPHMALSATQSAVQALELEGVLKGAITTEEWEKRVVCKFQSHFVFLIRPIRDFSCPF
jgi:2-polyprenyl-6-methoxyphenol hydroxylase-like FAD-dependent oxidoreductase